MVDQKINHNEYMTICLPMLSICDLIYMLKGYEKSKGAMMGLSYAKENNIEIYYQ